MSASEKLKALKVETEQAWPDGQAGTECIDCFTPVPSVAKLLMPALPQIVAVVEAAEDLAAWVDEQQAATGAEMLASLLMRVERDRAALSALSEALGGGDDARVQGLQADLQIADDAVRAMQDWRDGLEAKNARLREALAEIAQDPLGSHGARALARAALADPVEWPDE